MMSRYAPESALQALVHAFILAIRLWVVAGRKTHRCAESRTECPPHPGGKFEEPPVRDDVLREAVELEDMLDQQVPCFCC